MSVLHPTDHHPDDTRGAYTVSDMGRAWTPADDWDADAARMLLEPQAVCYVVCRQQWIKVGRTTTQHLHQRMRSLAMRQRSVLVPHDMDTAARLSWITGYDRNVEALLHERLADRRVRGEWFTADLDVLDDLVTLAAYVAAEAGSEPIPPPWMPVARDLMAVAA